MRKNLLVLLILLANICGCQTDEPQDFGEKKQYPPLHDPAWRVGDFEEPTLEIPDSLGGKNLTGFIVLSISAHKSGRLLGYKIRKIVVTLDTTKAPIEYFDMRPHIKAVTRSAQGDSLLRVFTPWIDQYFAAIDFTINKNNPAFAKYDTVSMVHDIRFNLLKSQ